MSDKIGMQMCRNGHPHPAGEPCAQCSPLYGKLVRQQVEIERLKSENDLLLGKPHAVHLGAQAAVTALRQCQGKQAELQAALNRAVGAESREAQLRTALRDTWKVLKKCESRMTRSAGCICVCPVIDGHTAECEVMAVRARHAHLVAGELEKEAPHA